MLLAVTMVATLMVGCGKNEKSTIANENNTTNGSSSEDKDAEEITLEFWTISLQPTFTDFFNGLIEEYESNHPGITIKWSDLPFADVQTKLSTAAAGGKAPDVVNLNTSLALALGGKGALTDLNKVATDEMKSVYVEALWKSPSIGDAVYAFPWYASPDIQIYNTELFEKAGLEVPSTYDEALDIAVEFYEKTGAYLFNPTQLFYILLQDGLDVLNEDGTAAAFNNQQVYDLLAKYKAVVDTGALPTTNWGLWDAELQMFETEQLGIISSSAASVSRIQTEAPDVYEKLGLGSPLKGTTGTSRNALMNIVVPSASKNQEAAVEFAHWITSDDIQLRFCKEVEIFPSTMKASQDDFFKADMDTTNGQARAKAAEANLTSQDFTLGSEKQDDIQASLKNLSEAIFADGMDIQEALDMIEKDVNDLLSH